MLNHASLFRIFVIFILKTILLGVISTSLFSYSFTFIKNIFNNINFDTKTLKPFFHIHSPILKSLMNPKTQNSQIGNFFQN